MIYMREHSYSPVETLHSLAMFAATKRMQGPPGSFIERCSPEARAALSKLTSDEARSMHGFGYHEVAALQRR